MIRLAVVLALTAACGPGVKGGPSMNNKMSGEPEKPVSPVVSSSILARDPMANKVEVKHVLVAWKSVGRDGKPSDERAKNREKPEAETIVTKVVGELTAKAMDFDTAMKTYSEDPGSASKAMPYTVSYDDMNFDSDFRMLAIRLHVDEVGVCESQFGFHIIKRIQ